MVGICLLKSFLIKGCIAQTNYIDPEFRIIGWLVKSFIPTRHLHALSVGAGNHPYRSIYHFKNGILFELFSKLYCIR